MRYFIVKDGVTVVGKDAYEGDDEKIDSLIAEYKTQNPKFTVSEIDQETSDATQMTMPRTKLDWQSAKQLGTDSAISYIAKQLGLE